MVADCFEWAVEIMISIAELIRHRTHILYKVTTHQLIKPYHYH